MKLAESHPHLVAELVDPSQADEVTAGSNRKLEWVCSIGHTWEAQVGNRTRETPQGCPYCGNRRALPGFNDLATLRPELATQLVDRSLGTQLTLGAEKQVEWACDRGHIWSARVRHRTKGNGSGCPYCAGRKAWPGETDLATLRPDLAAELADSANGQLRAGSNKRVEWQCAARGHTWHTTVSNRTKPNGSGCPYCAGNLAWPGETDLATVRPELAAELADPELACELTEWSNRVVSWVCPLGHPYHARVESRSRGQGCPFCAGRKVWSGFNDLASQEPALAAELVGIDPASLPVGTKKAVQWRCQLGHEYEAPVARRTGGSRTGCPVCSGHVVLVGFNDLASRRPELAAELVDASQGTKLTVATAKKVRWRCPNGHEYTASVGQRTRSDKPTGCSECAVGGFSTVSPGWLYLLATPGRAVFKFGITNYLDDRLEVHASQGFTEVVETHFFESGEGALAAETLVAAHARTHGWRPALTKSAMPLGGWSETLLADDTGDDFTLAPFVAQALQD